MARLGSLLRRLLFWAPILSLVYLATFRCRTDYTNSSPLLVGTCNQINHFVYPHWDVYIYPQLQKLDDKHQISQKLSGYAQSGGQWVQDLDEKAHISSTIALGKQKFLKSGFYAQIRPAVDSLNAKGQDAYKNYQKNWAPHVNRHFDHYSQKFTDSVDSSLAYLGKNARTHSIYAYSAGLEFFSSSIAPHLHKLWRAFVNSELLQQFATQTHFDVVTDKLREIYSLLAAKSEDIMASMREKTNFVSSEFKNILDQKIQPTGKKNSEVLSAVETILKDVSSSVSSKASSLTAVSSTFSETEPETITISSTITETAEPTADPESEESESDEELTSTRTLTVTEFSQETDESDLATRPNDGVREFEDGAPQTLLEQEIAYWKSKVDKTLRIAQNGLESDFGSYLDSVIGDLGQNISANLTALQQNNYLRYKKINHLISEINKDAEYIQESGELVENPTVDRQMMRDEIAGNMENVANVMKLVEDALNAQHAEVVEKYLEIAQSTVDVLESFAETTMSDFSNRLTSILHIVEADEDYKDEMGWAAWKEFHKVKGDIFNLRDRLFDEANAYKENHTTDKMPKGLQPWRDYLKKVSFHMNFLTRDNEEYLQLVRAKANVAYQLRESLIEQIEQKQAEPEESEPLEEPETPIEKPEAPIEEPEPVEEPIQQPIEVQQETDSDYDAVELEAGEEDAEKLEAET